MSEAVQVEHVEIDPSDPLVTIRCGVKQYDVYRLQISGGFLWEVWGPDMAFPNWWHRFWSRVLLGFKWTKTGEKRTRL